MAEDFEGQRSGIPASAAQFTLLWLRIKQHRIVQWAVGYVALIFAVQHAVTLTTEAFEWPHLVVRVSMLLLVLGLPIVVALAWYHGERVNRRISGPELTIISLLLFGISILFYVFVRPSQEIEATTPAVKTQIATTNILPAPSGVSVVVLPFLNLSGDPKQEFFSDGMTEEITSALANVKGLNVVARTSAFQFKGENKDVRAIGQALGANQLIEGSVRKAGNRVRITVQLIRADTGAHIWTESYDRELKDVFAVQEDIAETIAATLQVSLGLNQGAQLVSNRTVNTTSYQDYLRARALYRARDLNQSTVILERVVASDPGYAPAWALLAASYNLVLSFTLSPYDGSMEQLLVRYRSYADRAKHAAQKALSIDPRNATAHAAMASIAADRLDWVSADQEFREALARDPDDADILNLYSYRHLMAAGYLDKALGNYERVRKLEPLVPIYKLMMGIALMHQKRYADAIDLLRSVPSSGPIDFNLHWILAVALAETGRYREAADTLFTTPPSPVISRTVIEDAARYLRSAPAVASAPEALPAFNQLNFVYELIGAQSRAFEFPERHIALDGSIKSALVEIWAPLFEPLRKTERFKALMRKAKLVDYWRAHGWPDLCHPVGADDFACN
jgi:TolB-like protein/Flp pilus assembly protein TadD